MNNIIFLDNKSFNAGEFTDIIDEIEGESNALIVYRKIACCVNRKKYCDLPLKKMLRR